jgi:flagellar biosynthesis protein FlhF
MKIRRFFAKDMRTGLKQVSHEMGAEAAILSTNSVNGGIEIVAATDYEEAIRFSKLDNARKTQSEDSVGSAMESGIQLSKTGVEVQLSQPIEQINFNNPNQKTATKSSNLLNQTKTQQPTRTNNIPHSQKQNSNPESSVKIPSKPIFNSEGNKKSAQQQMNWGTDPVISNVHDELKLLRGMLQGQFAENDWSLRKSQNPIEAELLKRLVNLGLPVELAQKYATADEHQELGDAWYKVAACFAQDLPIAEKDIIETGGCYALVGPTGVGKTTSVAKLAAMAVKKYGADSVALISTDSYRIAAHQQLEIFAQIMGVVVASVSDANELDQALNSFAEKKLILIDTAGISQRDKRLTEQQACLNVSNHKIKHLLVLSATSQLANLNESIKRFGQLRLHGAIITKLDEATSLGKVLSTITRSQLSLYYITDGQNVPDDIHQAKAHQLVTEAISLANQYPREQAEEWQLAQNLKRVS